MDYFNYKRRQSSEVRIGNTPLGSGYPIRLQSMTNTPTLDTDACIEQSIRIIDAGADYVRLTAQGVREAENLANIENGLQIRGYHTPLVADIHFNPNAAGAAARIVEKVRINPGNFVDAARTFKKFEYTDEEYDAEIERIRKRLFPFLQICREHGTAIRLGVNHGSLSDRIMSRYGDTPEGMVESCMEFLRICTADSFHDVVISIKASNTVVMVETVRLLVEAMDRENMHYPLHLGVTEAGDGEDGRIKSAVGIGALLADGIGDTIRVSLSEEPEMEIPVARKLAAYISARSEHDPIEGHASEMFDYIRPQKRKTHAVGHIGAENHPVVLSDLMTDFTTTMIPDFIYTGRKTGIKVPPQTSLIIDAETYSGQPGTYPLFTVQNISETNDYPVEIKFVSLRYSEYNDGVKDLLKNDPNIVIIACTSHANPVGELRAFIHRLIRDGITSPVILKREYRTDDPEDLQVYSGADLGTLLLDYLGEGIWLQNEGNIPAEKIVHYMFGILQATRQRISKTEYISCPGCGRTLFDLQKTIARVKAATTHLKGLKIGVMGCIVNGPGEMADADYGYVGAARGKVSLYKNKVCVEKNIPEEQAVDKLVELIKLNGDWKEQQ